MNLFGIVFSNPALWAGLVAVAIPPVVHLLTKHTPVVLVFPTIRFLQGVKANQSRLYRLRHLLLMLLRCLAVMLILGAFLRPVHKYGGLSDATDPRMRNAAILVLDCSLSMTFSAAGMSPLARAKAAGDKILEGLGEGDVVNLIEVGAQPRMVFDEPRANIAGIRRGIRESPGGLARANADAAIALAVKQLESFHGYQKEIHFLSDFQRSNWGSAAFESIPQEVKTVFISAAEKDPSNSAVIEILSEPPVPALGEKVNLSCKVANYTAQARDVPIRLSIEGGGNFDRTLSIEPGSTASTNFSLRFNESGIYEGELSIAEDALKEDDKRYFALTVTDQVQVAVLSDESEDNTEAGHRYLLKAIQPSSGKPGQFRPIFLRPKGFNSATAAHTRATLVSGVNDFTPSLARDLLQYVKDGGSLLYFLCRETDVSNLKLLEQQSSGELQLPFEVTGSAVEAAPATVSAPEVTAVVFQEANYDDPLLGKFRETTALSEPRFYRTFPTVRRQAQGQVLLRYDNSAIALAKKTYGLGTILLANFSPSPSASDLAKHPVFLPFLHEMLRSLRPPAGEARQCLVGAVGATTVRILAPNPPVRFTDPSGKAISAGIDIHGDDAAVLFAHTSQTGFYRIHWGNKKIGSVAVNIDSRESNLDSLPPEQIRRICESSRNKFFAEAHGDASSLRRLREGTPLWHFSLTAALLFLGIEQLLSLIWKK